MFREDGRLFSLVLHRFHIFGQSIVGLIKNWKLDRSRSATLNGPKKFRSERRTNGRLKISGTL